MTAISDIPIVEPITGNKRHTYYGVQQPSAPPAKPGASSKDSDKQPLLGSSSSDSKPLLSENLILLEDKNVDGPEAVANPVLQGKMINLTDTNLLATSFCLLGPVIL